jgi:hypothetical protein
MSAIVLTLLLAASGLSNEDVALEAEKEFDRGVAAMQREERSRHHFLAAARGFEELRRRGANNAVLERNLGNAYLLADEVPQAILAYRRGLRLSPGDRALRANLAEARKRVIFQEGTTLGRPPEDIRPAWLPHLPRTLFALAAVAYVVFWIGLTRWFMVRRRRALVVAGVALAVAVVTTSLLIVSWRAEPSRLVVVIAENGVLLRKGNGRMFPPRYETPLNRGVEAQRLHRRDGWLQIELAGGEVGWVAETEAVFDEDD